MMKLRACMLMILMGYGRAMPQDVASPYSPPFSNNAYSCRCLPCFDQEIYRGIVSNDSGFALHRKFCELRSYVRSLDEYMQFVSGIVGGQLDDSAAWFLQQAENKNTDNGILTWLKKQGEALKDSHGIFKTAIRENLKRFPFDALNKKLQSETIKAALENLQKTGDMNKLNDAWLALSDFAMEQPGYFDSLFARDIQKIQPEGDASPIEKELWCAFVCVKEISDVTYVLCAFFAHICAETCIKYAAKGSASIDDFVVPSKNADQYAIVNMLDIYATVNTLPLESTLKTINRFMKKFAIAIKKLQGKADNNFVGWLKSKWVLIPLAVGVIVIKTVQYFWTQNEEESSNDLFFDDVFVDDARRIVIDNG